MCRVGLRTGNKDRGNIMFFGFFSPHYRATVCPNMLMKYAAVCVREKENTMRVQSSSSIN